MKIGAHVSAAENLALAPARAAEIGCECFQFFSRSPQGGPAKSISEEIIKEFKSKCRLFRLSSYIHAPYYINLASLNNKVYYGSISVLKSELERGSALGVKCLMTHLGSAKEAGRAKAMDMVIAGIEKVISDYSGKTKFLVEISAGAGEIIGDTFEEIAGIICSDRLKKYQIGVCFDTAHAFASGYDLRDEKAVNKTFKEFDKIIGLKKLKLIHANDSIAGLGGRRDRHAHIGEGEIGLAGFKAIVKLARKRKIDMIIETPHDGKDSEDIEILKKLRKAAV